MFLSQFKLSGVILMIQNNTNYPKQPTTTHNAPPKNKITTQNNNNYPKQHIITTQIPQNAQLPKTATSNNPTELVWLTPNSVFLTSESGKAPWCCRHKGSILKGAVLFQATKLLQNPKEPQTTQNNTKLYHEYCSIFWTLPCHTPHTHPAHVDPNAELQSQWRTSPSVRIPMARTNDSEPFYP